MYRDLLERVMHSNLFGRSFEVFLNESIFDSATVWPETYRTGDRGDLEE
jgi:hypothetical protein